MAEYPIQMLPEILAGLAASGDARFQLAMENISLQVEAEMKRRVREGGSHTYGTKTPASVGSGPAVISGELARSITHQHIGDEWRIGPASIPHSNYTARKKPRKSRKGSTATTGQIGEWLENGGRYGYHYPFVQPTVDAVSASIEATIKATFEPEL